jgi:hypothetical protein
VKTIWYILYWLAIFGVTLRVLLRIEENTRASLKAYAFVPRGTSNDEIYAK